MVRIPRILTKDINQKTERHEETKGDFGRHRGQAREEPPRAEEKDAGARGQRADTGERPRGEAVRMPGRRARALG